MQMMMVYQPMQCVNEFISDWDATKGLWYSWWWLRRWWWWWWWSSPIKAKMCLLLEAQWKERGDREEHPPPVAAKISPEYKCIVHQGNYKVTHELWMCESLNVWLFDCLKGRKCERMGSGGDYWFQRQEGEGLKAVRKGRKLEVLAWRPPKPLYMQSCGGEWCPFRILTQRVSFETPEDI